MQHPRRLSKSVGGASECSNQIGWVGRFAGNAARCLGQYLNMSGKCGNKCQTRALSTASKRPCNISPDSRLHNAALLWLLSFLPALLYFYAAYSLPFARFFVILRHPFTSGGVCLCAFGQMSLRSLFYSPDSSCLAVSCSGASIKSTSVMPSGMLRQPLLVVSSRYCARIYRRVSVGL